VAVERHLNLGTLTYSPSFFRSLPFPLSVLPALSLAVSASILSPAPSLPVPSPNFLSYLAEIWGHQCRKIFEMLNVHSTFWVCYGFCLLLTVAWLSIDRFK